MRQTPEKQRECYWRDPERKRAKALEYYYNKQEEIKGRKRQHYAENKAAIRLERNTFAKENPEYVLLQKAKTRAKERSIPFNLELSDVCIPETCPVLGIPLQRGISSASNGSPTVDRVDSSKGYVKGNVCVISWRANRLKSDASLSEVRALVSYMEAKCQTEN